MYYNIIEQSDVSTLRNWGYDFSVIFISKILKCGHLKIIFKRTRNKVLPAFSELFSKEKLISQFENHVR